MALITCKDCKKEFSTDAKRCPHCGAYKPKSYSITKAFLILLFIGWLVSLGDKPRSYETKSVIANATNNPPAEPVNVPNGWSYSVDHDSMTSKNTYFASVDSINTVNFDFPYQGTQNATLQLRTHPRWGKDIILSLQKGQFLCRFDGCNVLVRFDDEKPIRFTAGEPSDHSTTYIFIKGYSSFLSKMQKAKKLRIAAEFYQNGVQTFEFDVSNFDQNRYLAKQ